MSTYTFINKNAAAVGVAYLINYTVPAATTAVLTAGTITNILSDPVAVTVTINNGAADVLRINAIQLNPGATMNPLSNERWILPTGYILKVKSGTAASIDVSFDGVEIS